jgi:hypothetical protein
MVANVTGGDLYHLWRVSEVHLPRVADVFYDANRLLGGAAANTGDSFRANTSVYPGASFMTGSVGAAWDELRGEMQAMTEQIGTTILEAAEGVRQATQAYLESDIRSKDLLSRYLADPASHDPYDPASNPPVAGAEDSPGQPVPVS